jgi:hypothetical protein
MPADSGAGDVAGLALLALAMTVAAARFLVSWMASARRAPLVEDRVSRPRALQLEEAIGPGDQQHAVPQPRGVLATRDR